MRLPAAKEGGVSTRITVREICERLRLPRSTVYRMLETHTIPAIRPGKNWIVSRHAYETWERTFGLPTPPMHHPLESFVADRIV